MLKNLFARKPDQAKLLYEAIVAAARQPKFYTTFGVADKIEGRFDLLILHVYLVVARLKVDAPETCQKLIDLFCDDMDSNLREMGVGDLGVGKKVRRMAEALTGRMMAYEAAGDDEQKLVAALKRNVYQGNENQYAKPLALWLLNSRAGLAQQNIETIVSGKVIFS